MATNIITTLQSTTLNGITGSTMAIGNNLTTNAIQIGDAQTTGTITIGGTARTTGPINIGTGTTTAVPITIGGTGSSTTIGGTLGVTGTISANGGLTIGGNKNITLGNGSVKPTVGQVGYTVLTNIASPVSCGSSGSTTTVLTINSIPAGTYIFTYGARFNSMGFSAGNNITATTLQSSMRINTLVSPESVSGNGSIICGSSQTVSSGSAANVVYLGTWTGYLPSSTTVNLEIYSVYTPVTAGQQLYVVTGYGTGTYIKYTRIA